MRSFYSNEEKEKLKANLIVIALSHNVPTPRGGRSLIEVIATLKAKRLTAKEIEVLRKLADSQGVDYDEIPAIKPEKKPKKKRKRRKKK